MSSSMLNGVVVLPYLENKMITHCDVPQLKGDMRQLA